MKKVYFQEIKDEEDLPGEEWRDVVGFEDRYIVSNLGRARSLDRLSANGHKLKGRLLSPRHRKDDYWDFSLFDKNGKEHKVLLHRVVAEAWVERYDYDLNVVDHIDNNPCNCMAINLRYTDSAGNNDDPVRWQRIEQAKADHADKQLICVNHKSLVYLDSIVEASEKIGCNYSKLSAAIRYGNWIKGWLVGYSKDEWIKREVTKLIDKSGYCIKIYVKNDNEDGYRIQPLEKIGA